MDAKAKIVRWECRPLNWEVQYQQRDDGEWVKFTDHEAALAELVAERDAEAHAKNHYIKEAELFVLSYNQLNARYTTLLTGLEALAGEWKKEPAGQYEYDQGHAEGMHDCGNELSYRLAECRTITNSAKGGA